MARTVQENGIKADQTDDKLVFQADGADRIDLPSTDFVADAKMTREGDNLILVTPNGEVAVIEGYFSADPAPVLHAPDGAALTPNLVEAFVRSPMEFAANNTASDESPVGAVEEVKGNATVTRADGTVETITNGTPIYQGDIVQTDAEGAVNIVFIDETSMAISANARLAIDEYSYDPATESGTTNFSVLRGLFVFTSGLIGRDDPDDVKIDTPVGSIGIRGTIIAGEINPGGESNISVLEGAIVVKNGGGELTLSEQFETVRLMGFDQPMKDMGVISASDINTRFSSVSDVNPSLFTMINDAAKEQSSSPAPEAPKVETAPEPTSSNEQQTPAQDNASINAAHDVFASIDGSVANLNSSATTGLPSQSAVTGQSSTTSTIAVGAAITANPVAGSSAANAAGQTAQHTSIDTQQPPPSVIGSATGANAGTGTGTPVIPAWAKIDLSDTSATANNSHHLIGDSIDNRFGFSISALGDTDQDGFADFIVGNNSSTAGQNHSYIFIGSLNGITNTTPAGTTVANNTAGSNFSESIVAGIGDFNGDGMLDFAVGQAFNNTGTRGQVVINGYNSGLNTSTMLVNYGGVANGDEYGASVSGVGDYNNDGYADIVIGSPGGAGYAKLIQGGSLTSTPYTPLGSTDTLGSSVSGIGDFNGDGYSDFAIGAAGGNYVDIHFGFKNGASAPTVQTLTGTDAFGTEVQGLGDINGDGYSDLLIGGDNSGALFFGGAGGSRLDLVVPSGSNIIGGGAAGDFNGDGYKDFTISFDDGTKNETYIVFGKDGIESSILDYNYLQNYNNAIKITYPSVTDALNEVEIASIGDVNGDGYDDIGIGVVDSDTMATGDGGVFVVYGRDTGNTHSGYVASADSQSIVGNSGNNTTLSDGGFENVSLRGGAGNDWLSISNVDFLSINGGGNTENGLDKLLVNGSLDFSDVNFERISGIEGLVLNDASGQNVTLTMENLFNLLKSSSNGELHIEAGGSGGQFNLLLGGSTFNDATDSQVTANLITATSTTVTMGTDAGSGDSTFSIGGYTLYIDQNVQVNLA